MSPRRQALLIAGLTVAVLLPFVNKAFHIDDTLFLKAARQIRENPLDFYGFSVNWYGTEQRMSDVTKNPPLASYFLALAGAAAGWSEPALHGAFLLPAAAAALGISALARRLTARPVLATIAAIATPAFLVSSTNVMCDTMLVAFWVWAVERWIRGIETGRASTLVFAGILTAAAALTKYFGVALVPLLLAYALARRRRIGAWALALLVPVIVLAGYQAWTHALYGHGLLTEATGYAKGARVRTGARLPAKTLVGLSFAGGCLTSVACFAPWLWRGRTLALGGLVAVLAVAGFAATDDPARSRPDVIVQLVAFGIAGVGVIALSFADLFRRRDAGALLLFLWVFGTFAFAVFVNWTVNARSLLPAAPAAAILLARRLESRGFVPSRLVPALPILFAASLAVVAAWADWTLAGAARTAAARLAAATPARGTLWFEGHWGFQHYMEAAGAKPIDVLRSHLSVGDRIAIPVNNTNLFPLREGAVARVSGLALPVFPFLTTLSESRRAGFYVDSWGPLPISFGRVPPEHYFLFEVVGNASSAAR